MKKLKAFILTILLAVPFAIFGCENKTKVSLEMPSYLVAENGTIIFSSVKGADYYTLVINDEEIVVDYKNSPHVEQIDDKIYYNANKYFQVGENYSIRVKAEGKDKVDSPYTNNYDYIHAGIIAKPTSVATTGTVLTWESIENASYYLVKVVTPTTQLFDKSGNALIGDGAETIQKADIPEYQFNKNRFDFSSFLTTAGNYKFYVSAVFDNNNLYVTSGYTVKHIYTHKLELASPSIKSVVERSNELHMIMIVDENANGLALNCGEHFREVELNNTESSISRTGNILDINLNQFFQGIQGVDLSKTNLTFNARVKYDTLSASDKFYIDSKSSEDYQYTKIVRLATPTTNLEPFMNKFAYNWSVADASLVSGYKLYIFTPSGVREEIVSKASNSYLLDQDFLAVSVQALPVGDYRPSNLAQFINNPTITANRGNTTISFNSGVVSWNNYSNASYLVAYNDNVFITTENNIDISSYISEEDSKIALFVLGQGYKVQYKELSIDKIEKLPTPVINENQGFVSANRYILSFTGVDDAIGYNVYVKVGEDQDFTNTNILYTDTVIDLSKILSIYGNSDNVEIKLQAVANPYSIYDSSDLSNAINIATSSRLDSPTFHQINGKDSPIIKKISGIDVQYSLKFYGVDNANSYEVKIIASKGINKISIPAHSPSSRGEYEVNISNYIKDLDDYIISVTAITGTQNNRYTNSLPASYNYRMTKQLSSVESISVEENNGKYLLKYEPVENADKYLIRILKLNDPSYEQKLLQLGLNSTFELTDSDITQYVTWAGEYQVYMTAQSNSEYFVESQESSVFGRIEKRNTLDTPTNFTFDNTVSGYIMNWTGDENADYYLIKIVQPNNVTIEINKNPNNYINISPYLNMQGNYQISVMSKVNTSGSNAMAYENSPESKINHWYEFKEIQDYKRCRNSIYGQEFDYYISSVEELKNVLWYHYLYGVDNGLNNNTNLSIYLEKGKLSGQPDIDETTRDVIYRLAEEADEIDINLYDFSTDETWKAFDDTATESELFAYLAKTLLNLYPEMNSLKDFSIVSHTTNNNIFNLSYKNALDEAKIKSTLVDNVSKITEDYGNKFVYLSDNARRNNSTVFNIDRREQFAYVTTSEQLIQVVQAGKQPIFIGNSQDAEAVYNNAKSVLLAIVNDKMTDVEKTTAIFDWLEYALTLDLQSTKKLDNGYLVDADISEYGLKEHFYLESIFGDIRSESNGGGDGEFYLGTKLATSESYSKAFALMCAIEGIDCVIVNGEYQYTISPTTYTKSHKWNKVYLSTSSNETDKRWYNVDLTFSDNRLTMEGREISKDRSYGKSTHEYFLVSDNTMQSNNSRIQGLNFVDKNYIKSKSYSDNRIANSHFDYYANNTFGLSLAELGETAYNLGVASEFKYAKLFDSAYDYQSYPTTQQFGARQNYILNNLLYANHVAKNNDGYATIEFKLNNTSVMALTDIQSVNDEALKTLYNQQMIKGDTATNLYTYYDSISNSLIVVFTVRLL